MASYIQDEENRQRQRERESKRKRERERVEKMRAYAAADMPSLKKCVSVQRSCREKWNWAATTTATTETISHTYNTRNGRYAAKRVNVHTHCESIVRMTFSFKWPIERTHRAFSHTGTAPAPLHTFDIKKKMKKKSLGAWFKLNRSLSSDWLTDWLAMHFHGLWVYNTRKRTA